VVSTELAEEPKNQIEKRAKEDENQFRESLEVVLN
jgi:hypothetical protein